MHILEVAIEFVTAALHEVFGRLQIHDLDFLGWQLLELIVHGPEQRSGLVVVVLVLVQVSFSFGIHCLVVAGIILPCFTLIAAFRILFIFRICFLAELVVILIVEELSVLQTVEQFDQLQTLVAVEVGHFLGSRIVDVESYI